MIGFKGTLPMGRWLCAFLCLTWMMVSGCGRQGGNDANNPTGSGGIQVRTVWQTRDAPPGYQAASPSGDVCADYLITHIRVRVRSVSDQIVADSGELGCALHTAQLSGIAAGEGYRVEVDGLLDGQVEWYGHRGGVTVVGNQTTPPVVVTMSYTGEDQSPPAVTISPADAATHVPTDAGITVSFDKSVVEASVNTDSVQLTDGVDRVAGTLTYNPDTLQAVFQPDQPLKVSTTYTVTVTTEVMDRTGQTIPQAIGARFTTTMVWYVDQEQPRSGDGKQWDTAFRTIEEAMTAAAGNDHVWVKQGTYDLNRQIYMDKPVVLLGGFAGTETQHHQRDWQNRPTRLDAADGDHRCFYISADAVVDGFDIVGFDYPGQPILEGGIMYIDGVSPRIENCTFRGSDPDIPPRHGGAIYIAAGSPRIRGCTFSGNRVEGSQDGTGGAIHNEQGGPLISDCRFVGNGASGMGGFGGAIANNQALPATTIENCVFASNSAGGESGSGGAIYNDNSSVHIDGCRFEDNSTGGMSGSGGAIANKFSNAVIQNCTFDTNRASSLYTSAGGAVYNSNSSPVITHCSFYGNETQVEADDGDAFGGAIASSGGGNPSITNSILWGNRANIDNEVYDAADTSSTIAHCDIDQNLPAGNQNYRKQPRFGAGLHLRPDSPCIGIGGDGTGPATDMDGEARPQGSTADTGADQFIDGDGDGLPDHWEQLHGIDAPGGDADSDRLPEMSEYNLGTDPRVAEIVLDASIKGRVSSGGIHVAADTTTTTGGSYRAYLGFSVTGLAPPVTRAAIRLELTGYDSNAIPVALEIADVTTDAAVFASDLSGQDGVDVFDDLAQGDTYGKFEVIPTDEGTVLEFRLNRTGLNRVNSAIYGASVFIVGLTVDRWAQSELLFGQDSEIRTHQLVLTP